MAVTTAGAVYGGVPLDIAALIGTGVGQAADRLIPTERSQSAVVGDDANHERLALAVEDFGGGVAIVWRSTGLLATFRPRVLGRLHGLLLLMREQRRFENETAALAATLSDLLLYASTKTQRLAIEVYRTLGDQMIEVGRHGQGTKAAKIAVDAGSLKIGDCVVAWRAAAQVDLGWRDHK
jgi:hypothetical protein